MSSRGFRMESILGCAMCKESKTCILYRAEAMIVCYAPGRRRVVPEGVLRKLRATSQSWVKRKTRVSATRKKCVFKGIRRPAYEVTPAKPYRYWIGPTVCIGRYEVFAEIAVASGADIRKINAERSFPFSTRLREGIHRRGPSGWDIVLDGKQREVEIEIRVPEDGCRFQKKQGPDQWIEHHQTRSVTRYHAGTQSLISQCQVGHRSGERIQVGSEACRRQSSGTHYR